VFALNDLDLRTCGIFRSQYMRRGVPATDEQKQLVRLVRDVPPTDENERLIRPLLSTVAVVLFAFGAVAAIIGIHDALLRDASLAVNVFGLILGLSGGLSIVGATIILALGAWRRSMSPGSARLSLVACVIGIIVGGYFCLAELRSLSKAPVIIGVSALVVLASLVGFLVLRLLGARLGGIGRLGLALAATTFGAFQFWYTNQYLPLTAVSAPTASAALSKIGEFGDLTAYTARVTVKNEGTTRIVVLASSYYVTAATFTERDAKGPP
jgi:hypothetical protein